MFLTVFGWSLLLLPFSIASRAPDGWKTGYIIAMIVLGAVLLVAFGVWEKFFAPVSYFPWKYLKDRTILGACLLYGFMFASILYVATCTPSHPATPWATADTPFPALGTRTTTHTLWWSTSWT